MIAQYLAARDIQEVGILLPRRAKHLIAFKWNLQYRRMQLPNLVFQNIYVRLIYSFVSCRDKLVRMIKYHGLARQER